jgi:hypothetical protein
MRRHPNRWKVWAGLNRNAPGNTSSIIADNLRISEIYSVCRKFRNACTLGGVYLYESIYSLLYSSCTNSLAAAIIMNMPVSMLRRQGTAHGRYINPRYHTMIPQASLHPKPRRAWSCPVSHLFLHWLHSSLTFFIEVYVHPLQTSS